MPELLKLDTELAMQEAFAKRAEAILSNAGDYVKDPGTIKIGLEVEYSLFDTSWNQIPEETRDGVIEGLGGFVDSELGASQIELRTDPIDVQEPAGFGAVYQSLSERQWLLQNSARWCGAVVLSSGSNPLVPIETIQRTSKPKYETVPNFYNEHRGDVQTVVGTEGLDVGEAAIMSLFNSVQANIEAKNFEDAVDKLNRSLMIGPLAVAMTGNSRFVELRDSSFDDVRMVAWALSHDTRTQTEIEEGVCTRVGLPNDYYSHIGAYFQEVSSFPFILDDPEHALEIGIGLNWRHTRIKFIGNSAVVEFRPVSTQPSPEENTAAMAFYIGRLLWSQKNNEDLLPMSFLRENEISAMIHGPQASLWVNDNGGIVKTHAQEALPIEIERALTGLIENSVGDMNFSKELMGILYRNAVEGSPSSKLKAIVASSPETRTQAIVNGFAKLKSIYY